MQAAILHLKAADPIMGGLIEGIGPYSIQYMEPNFDTLVKAIVLQQLSGKVADVIFGRLRKSCGNGCLTPDSILRRRLTTLRAAGLSGAKIDYIRDLARRVRDGSLDLDGLRTVPDEDVHRVLTGIKGIGPWTVQMFLMFALRRPDVLAPADLGIQAAVQKAYGLERRATPAQVQEYGEKWRPYRTVASWYLWRSLETKAGL
ncbi:MAG TPA: DNA-3-methyladenine glycosylase [Bryobacteraceae bacterium]|nr:DNA-3-methyladenine glycosylase [Bryobacteraceae bacterium]